MKKHFESLIREIESRLRLFLENRIDRFDPKLHIELKPIVGSLCYIKKNLETIITGLETIEKICMSELNGTLEREIGKLESTERDVYDKILWIIERDDLSILTDLRNHINFLPESVSSKDAEFYHLYSKESLAIENSDGIKKIMSKEEAILRNYRTAYEIKINLIEGWDITVRKIKKLANEKSNLGKIIELVK